MAISSSSVMTDFTVLQALNQKLGHGLVEVRVRALDTVLSKLDRGFLNITDLSTSKEFLVKLLEWFGIKPCTYQDRVLGLILKILKEGDSKRLVAQIGAHRFLLALNTIRESLPSELCPLLDDIVGLVRRSQLIQGQCDSESDSNRKSHGGPSEVICSEQQSESCGNTCLLDASLEEALQENFVPLCSTEPVFNLKDQALPEVTVLSNVLKHILLPWQPLISTDRHVLIAVESSLSNTADCMQLLNTCSFLTNVMMRDFPPEVFLQRPGIVMTFMKLLKSSFASSDKQLAGMVVVCLITLTDALQCRLRCFLDPNLANIKQEIFFNHEEDAASNISAESLVSNLGGQVDIEGLKRIPEWNDYIKKSSGSQASSQSSSHSFEKENNSADRSHFSETQIPSDSAASKDSSVLQLQQCSLPQFCLVAMRHVTPHVDTQPESTLLLFKLSRLLTNCITPQIWLAPASDLVATDIATHLFEMFEVFGETLLQERSQTVSRLVHLQLLAVIRHLLVHLVPVEVADRCLPRQMKSALCSSLLDGPLHAFFPSLHSDLHHYTKVFKNLRDVDCVKLFESTLSVAESLSSAAKLLTEDDRSDGSKVILSMECALTSLPFHQDFRFIPMVFDSCSKNYHKWHLTESEHNTMSGILLKVLAHATPAVRSRAYAHLHRLVLESLSVQHSHQSPAESLAFLLFNTPLLLEITTHGIASTDDVIQNSAEDIILHTLKGRFLLGSTHWKQFLASLEPVLPLLQSWTDKPSALGRSIMAMLNPDVGSQMSLETPELLKGNLRLLFSKSDLAREEAIARLIWLLTKEEEAFNKLPHISTLQNCVKDSMFLGEKSVDVFHQIPEQSFYHESSLIQVLEIVETSGVEPRMLLSAMTQVAAILEDPRHHETFLLRAGLSMAIEYLHASVSAVHPEIYPEVVVPTVSILRSLSLHHTITRHQLSKDIKIFYSVVRGLFMFPSDLRLRINAAQLLTVLLYDDVMISSSPRSLSDGFVIRGLSVPHLIDLKMKLPVVCQTHWKTSHFTEPLMTDIFLRHDECRDFLATAWNLSFFQCEVSPLLWISPQNPPKAVADAQKNFSPSMLLKDKNLKVLQASAMLNLCQKQLLNIQQASIHFDVTRSLDILKSILALYTMIKDISQIGKFSSSDTLHFQQLYKSLPWRQTFRRFLIAAPASVADQQLLIEILHFLKIHVSASQSLGLLSKDNQWLSKQLQHPSQPLPNLFHTVAHTGYAGDNEMPQELAHLSKWKELCKELLSVITECANFEQHLLQKSPPYKEQAEVGVTDEDDKENKEDVKRKKIITHQTYSCSISKINTGTELEQADEWVGEVVSCATTKVPKVYNSNFIHVIQNIVSCLKSSDTQHFYNLAYLDWLLSALTNLTSRQGWSTRLKCSQQQTLFSELLSVLLELVQAFHLECGKGGSSYMGLSITRTSILCLNHLLEEMQLYKELEWENFWYITTRKASRTAFYVPWLPSLFRSCEPVVRAAALQLAAGIALSPKGCDHVMSMMTEQPDVWMTLLCILLDRSEASLVREQAANLLTNLIKGRMGVSEHGDDGFENSRSDILVQHLSEGGFLVEVWSILDSLSLATCWETNHHIRGNFGVGLMHWSLESGAHSQNLAHLPSNQCILVPNDCTSDQDRVSVPSTPSLIRSLCNFIDAISDISNDILPSFEKTGLSSQLLRCVDSVPPLDPQNQRSTHLYCDTLRMYTSICHLVDRCISCDVVTCQYIPQQPHMYHKLLLLLDPTLFSIEPQDMQSLRDELWTEVLWLLSRLLTTSAGDDSCKRENGHSVFHSLLIRSRGEPLVSVLATALSGSLITDLQTAAVACVQSLLSHPASKQGQPFAVLLDDVDADFNSSLVAVKEPNIVDSIGASLCRYLLALYNVHSLQIGSTEKSHPGSGDRQAQRSAVAGALSAVMAASISAKVVAVNQGLVELLCAQLGAIQCHLVLEPRETMKRLATKKKFCPVLQDLGLLFGLLNSVTSQNTNAKELASDIGVTDTIHKLWNWFLAQPSLLLIVLKFLGTLTSGCPAASHSLVLTTSVPGLGLRMTPSSQSLLHAIVALVLQETEAATGSHDHMNVLSIACSVLCNACHVPECRTALTKGNLLRGIHHLHSRLSKKIKQRRHVETIWLGLLVQLSAYQEGQSVLPKIPDLLQYLMQLAEGQKKNNKLALQVLRNIAFSPINRPRLLGSGEFLLLINKKLQEGDTDDQVAAAASLWALVANNQKGKLTAKCSGIDVQILDSLRQLAVCHRPGADFVAQLLNCVLKIVRHEPNSSVS